MVAKGFLDPTTPVGARFWAKVEKRDDGCWEWIGPRAAHGYGSFSLDGRERAAHRLSYEHHFGAIPAGLFALHHCDNPPCVAPTHLFLGTAADNARDMASKGRSFWKQRTHCPRGHAYTGSDRGYRRCLTCHRDRERERYRTAAAR